MKDEEYYLGLDCGTTSVGWAVTDTSYNIPKAKGKRLWGARLFDAAEPAVARRLTRSARRRNERTKRRLKLLEFLFAEEIAKTDPDFYIRLRESFYLEEDKRGLSKKSKNTLFNDESGMLATDKDFHKLYPTIWHLRSDLMSTQAPRDIRLYFLAIHHILKNRGHFLLPGTRSMKGVDFDILQDEFTNAMNNCDFEIPTQTISAVAKIVTSKQTKSDKQKELFATLMESVGESEDDSETTTKRLKELSKLITGSATNLGILFAIEGEEDLFKEDKLKYPFSKGVFEEKESEIEAAVVSENNMKLILTAKKIYDFALLSDLLKDSPSISEAMINNFNQHKSDLAALKKALKPFKEDHTLLFKSKDDAGIKVKKNNKDIYVSYAAYANGTSVKGKSNKCDQEDLNKEIEKILEKHEISGDLLDRAKSRALLPKQKGQAKGTIPMQLHLTELRAIITNLKRDYPSFCESDKYIERTAESVESVEKSKLESLLTFRIPYFVGPLVHRSKSPDFSWGEEQINEIIYPWNFDQLIDKNARANAFIRRMTNFCTYLPDQEVLPKNSITYQKYMVLNELNNLKINGARLEDTTLKQEIYKKVFVQSEISGNITLKKLATWLKQNRKIDGDFELSGIDISFKSKLTTEKDFRQILGADFDKYRPVELDKCVELITILGEEKQMLATKLQQTLNCTEEQAKQLSKKSYKGWAAFSRKFLTEIKAPVGALNLSILEAMHETNKNLMELRFSDFTFKSQIDELNTTSTISTTSTTPDYSIVDNLYCSPAVKRSIWQALKIVHELVTILGKLPKKIFIEVAREEKAEKSRKLSRRTTLMKLYSAIKNNDEAAKLLGKLNKSEDRDLQRKKLYLYYTQMARCAYSGDRIEIEDLHTSAYDIDHIYPRSKTKDDSIHNNLVLVKSALNREKLDTYPISPDIRSKMAGKWQLWLAAGLITKEKHARLVRATTLTDDELRNFITRQLVETRQSTKALIEIIEKVYGIEPIPCKAEQVSDFRKLFDGSDIYEWHKLENRYIKTGKRDSWGIKVRELNDLHHAKDAYLNIVVGNVYHAHFTSDPRKWIKSNQNKRYTLKPEVIFSETPKHETSAWAGQATISTLKHTILRNDILVTRQTYEETGQISDLNIVKKSSDLLPIKNTNRLQNTEKYGGYNSLKGAFFSLVELDGRKNTRERRLVQIPIIHAKNPSQYITIQFPDKSPKVILEKIPFKSYMKINTLPVHLTGKTDRYITFNHAVQVIFSIEDVVYIKNIVRAVGKINQSKGKYIISEEKDGVSKASNALLYGKFIDKVAALERKMPAMKSQTADLQSNVSKFTELTLDEQLSLFAEYLKLFSCTAATAKLKIVGASTDFVGKGRTSSVIAEFDSFKLIHQSPTGLYERTIDLKTCGAE